MKKAEIVKINYVELTEEEKETLKKTIGICQEILNVMDEADCFNVGLDDSWEEKNSAEFEDFITFLDDLADAEKLFLKE